MEDGIVGDPVGGVDLRDKKREKIRVVLVVRRDGGIEEEVAVVVVVVAVGSNRWQWWNVKEYSIRWVIWNGMERIYNPGSSVLSLETTDVSRAKPSTRGARK